MKPVDIVLGVLTLCAVGLGVAAYRAWHPEVASNSLAAAVEPLPNRSPVPVASAQMARLGDTWGPVNRVECRNGFLVEMTPQGQLGVVRNGQLAQCEIHAATAVEARRVSSAGPSDQ